MHCPLLLIIYFHLHLLLYRVVAINLLPFGASEGDQRNPKRDSGCGPKINLDKPFPFYGQNYHQLWVCNNGMLSFNDENSYFRNNAKNIMIAVFAANIDITTVMEEDSLANNIFWRKDSRRTTLDYINDVISKNSAHGSFYSSWAMVVTFYKVGYSIGRTDLLNTFQLVMACDDFNQCVCLFLYDVIQWTKYSNSVDHSALAGFSDGRGKSMWIPGSKTLDVLNWPRKSNVGVDGLFIYKVNQTGVEPQKSCNRKIWPSYADIYSEETRFELTGFLCDRSDTVKDSKQIEIVFMGSSYNISVSGSLGENDETITGFFPFWGKSEEVRVLPLLKDIQTKEAAMVYFLSPDQRKNGKSFLNADVISQSVGSVQLNLTWNRNYWKSKFQKEVEEVSIVMFNVKRLKSKRHLYEIKVHTYNEVNSGSVERNFEVEEGSIFIQIDTSDLGQKCNESYVKSFMQCAKYPVISTGPVVFVSKPTSCQMWYKNEENLMKRQKKPWFQQLGKTFGCPWNVLNNWLRNDAWYAKVEVISGLNGWELDPCCGGTPVNSFCTSCRMNPGADFCIQSPGIMMEEFDENYDVTTILVSNQCCYDSNGTLLHSEHSGAGNAKKSVNNLGNSMDYVTNEMGPYKDCCETEDSCDLYFNVRPVINGTYRPRTTIITWGDPHMKTLDGFEYTFNGLGVYQMLETVGTKIPNVTMQVSTRRSGKGTVFSGFFVADGFTSAEFFFTLAKDILISINGSDAKYKDFTTVEKDGVRFSRNESATEFGFKLEQSDFIVRVFITKSGILSFAISPPAHFQKQMRGLLGDFDGSEENDLTNRDGEIISTNSSDSTIHESFGETWAVPEEQWMFSLRSSSLIRCDLQEQESYRPVYEATFESETLSKQAKEVCGENENCLLDVALTGKIEFAESAKQVLPLVEVADELNQVALAQHLSPFVGYSHSFACRHTGFGSSMLSLLMLLGTAIKIQL